MTMRKIDCLFSAFFRYRFFMLGFWLYFCAESPLPLGLVFYGTRFNIYVWLFSHVIVFKFYYLIAIMGLCYKLLVNFVWMKPLGIVSRYRSMGWAWNFDRFLENAAKINVQWAFPKLLAESLLYLLIVFFSDKCSNTTFQNDNQTVQTGCHRTVHCVLLSYLRMGRASHTEIRYTAGWFFIVIV